MNKKVFGIEKVAGILMIISFAVVIGCSSKALTPENLFAKLTGNWSLDFQMTSGDKTQKFTGSTTAKSTGPTSADFKAVFKDKGKEKTETVKAWWDAKKKKLAIQENGDTRYFDLTDNGWKGSFDKNSIPELGIKEKVTISSSRIFVNSETMEDKGSIKNARGKLLVKWKGVFKRK